MADVLSVKLVGLSNLAARLDKITPEVTDRLRIFMARSTIGLSEQVQANILERFKSSGPLFKSVRSELTETPGSFTGRVYTQDVVYAAIQERGGKTAPHVIEPVNGKALAFMMPGRLGFSSGNVSNVLTAVKKVNHPGSNIPERSYARLALVQQRKPFESGIRQVVAQGVGAAMGSPAA